MFRPSPDDFDDISAPHGAAAQSDERMLRPDHKAKKHGRPRNALARRNETIGGGHFVFKRGRTTGRIKTGAIMAGKMPFEHADYECAFNEAVRLQKQHGGTFDVFVRIGSVEAREIGE